MKVKIKWLIWSIVSITGFILISFFVIGWQLTASVAECKMGEETLLEKQLANGDWMKIRQEPDCSFTGGPRIQLYLKMPDKNNYRRIARWRGSSAKGVKVYLNATTPIILTPATNKIIIRSARSGWYSIPLAEVINASLPKEFPLILNEDYVARYKAFDPQSSELTVVGNWGTKQYQFRLHLLGETKIEFVGFDKLPRPLSNELEIPTLNPLFATINKNVSQDFQLSLYIKPEVNNPKKISLATLPINCTTDFEAACARTRILYTHPENDKGEQIKNKIDFLSIDWLIEARRFETQIYLWRANRFQSVILPPIASMLATKVQPSWSITLYSIDTNKKVGDLQLNLLAEPVQAEVPPLRFPLRGLIPQAVVDRRCQRYRITLSVDPTTDAPKIAKIIAVAFDSRVMCHGKTLPTLEGKWGSH